MAQDIKNEEVKEEEVVEPVEENNSREVRIGLG